jgi:hypothetical protein
MMEAARTSETLVDNYFTRQYMAYANAELTDLRLFKNYEVIQCHVRQEHDHQ